MKTIQTKKDRSGAMLLPGAMAIAATTAGAHAGTVQITLIGNKFSSTGGNQLVADLTGDGGGDVKIDSAWSSTFGVYVSGTVGGINKKFSATWWESSFKANAIGGEMNGVGTALGIGSTLGVAPITVSYLNPLTFTDARINAGAATSGWLEVNAFNTSDIDHTVQFSRLIFDDASTTRPAFATIPGAQTEWQVSAVPEPSSSLALLALGAGGLLTRRRIKRAA